MRIYGGCNVEVGICRTLGQPTYDLCSHGNVRDPH
jgi:hypothetical protein